jgi:hypothetical protein
MMKALSSSETSVLMRATLRNIQEDGIPHSYCRENLKSYLESADVQLYSGEFVSPIPFHFTKTELVYLLL